MAKESSKEFGTDENAELEALRAEVEHLRRQGVATSRPRRDHHFWRWVACGVLFAFAAVLAIGGVAARYVRSELLDTDRYVQTVTPIAADPAVQAQIAESATAAIMKALNVDKVASDALVALTEAAPNLPPRVAEELPALAPAIASGVQNLVHTEVNKVLRSPAFQGFWVEANRAAHRNLVTILTGEGDTAIQIDERGNVTLSLGPIIDQVKEALSAKGLTIVNKVPQIDVSFVLFQSDEIIKLQRLVSLLDRVATALPFVAIGIAALGVLASPRGRRRKAISVFGLVLAASMALLGLGLNIGRSIYLNAIPPSVVSPSAATGVFDPIVEPLRLALRAVLAVGLAVAVAGYLTGTSRSAAAVRQWVARLPRRAHSNRTPSAVEQWIGQHRLPLQLAVLGVGALVLVMWQYPTGAVVGWIAVLTGLVCLALYVVGASAAADDGPAPGAPTRG